MLTLAQPGSLRSVLSWMKSDSLSSSNSSLATSSPPDDDAFKLPAQAACTTSTGDDGIDISSRQCPSSRLLDESRDPSKGAISREFGFMGDPKAIMSAASSLPESLLDTAKLIPQLYANDTLREHVETLDDSDFSDCLNEDLQGWDLLLAKSIIFTLAQAFVDSGRIDRGPGQPKDTPPPFPKALAKALAVLSTRLDSVPYCVLSDICLYNVTFTKESMDRLAESNVLSAGSSTMKATDLSYEDMRLHVPVLNGLKPNESEPDRAIREKVESRFFLTTVEMGYATSDMPQLVAEAQQAMYTTLQLPRHQSSHQDHAAIQMQSAQTVIRCLKELKQSAIRMRIAFGKMNMKDVPAKVWHKDVAKLTLGYNGNGGPSGPQHPTVHLLDIFIGRQSYKSELGEIIVKTRKLLAANHREFLVAVGEGPTIQEFLSFLDSSSSSTDDLLSIADAVATAANELVEEYTTHGFLAAHRKKAYAYLRSGFSGQVPRTFTAGSTYDPREDVPKQMLKAFTSSMSERLVKW